MEQELAVRGDEITITNHYDTDDEERYNWARAQEGKGFIRDERGGIQGREVANIPAPDAAMLEAAFDLDWLAFSRNRDRAAFRRLLRRFPYWRACQGGV
ncbi:MAG: hypothetical protein IJR68_04735 [Fretibacterium sp.]|nr:hypothetical protein [Fretibacterium sp.]